MISNKISKVIRYSLYNNNCIQLFHSTCHLDHSSTTTTTSSILKEKQQQQQIDQIKSNSNEDGIRINRCFPNYSRKQVDEFILSNRIKINGRIAKLGDRIPTTTNDNDTIIELDSKVINWKSYLEKVLVPLPHGLSIDNGFIYIKYWKDRNVTTTTSEFDESSILNTGHFQELLSTTSSKNSRLFPIGRLDNQSTGMILLTSDARLSSWLLGSQSGCSKVYEVLLDRVPTQDDLSRWSQGIRIDTPSSSGTQIRSHSTIPCRVRTLPTKIPLSKTSPTAPTPTVATTIASPWVEFILKEGRNQQIRKMVHALGYTTKHLHRSSFCGITLKGLSKPGTWAYLTTEELELLKKRK